MTEQELKALQETVGTQAAVAMKKQLDAYDEKAKGFAAEAAKGMVSKESFETWQKDAKEALDAVKEIAEKQGTSLAEINAKLNSQQLGTKSIAQVLKESEQELREIYSRGSGNKTFMVNVGEKGNIVMAPFDPTQNKAAGPVATVGGVNGGGNTASIAQNIDASSLLRLGGESQIISQYRNTPWIFDLCNIINAGYDTLMAMWFEEVPKQGGSATTPEGTPKPASQYAYVLKTATYKKEATLIGFTEEFSLDFARLQSDILGKGRIDLVNRINSQVLTNIKAAATPYNSGVQYKNGTALTAYNDYLALDACAAQVENATFGHLANAALMSTFKKHRLDSQLDQMGRFLMPPASLDSVARIGNPAMGTDDLIVGDFKQYNIINRGGLIVRVGYNGTDFAQNMFSTVLEQYYFDYISAIRAVAIVSGSTFSAVKTAITT
jgi:hypothetical protein